MADNWQVIEQFLDRDGSVLRQQVVMPGMARDAALALAADMNSAPHETPEPGQRFVYVAEEAG